MCHQGYSWKDAQSWAGLCGCGTELERLPVVFRTFTGINSYITHVAHY